VLGRAMLIWLWGRSKSWSSLSTLSCHYAAEEIAWTVADRGRSLLGRTGILRRSTDT
jgi:hypothetical protein